MVRPGMGWSCSQSSLPPWQHKATLYKKTILKGTGGREGDKVLGGTHPALNRAENQMDKIPVTVNQRPQIKYGILLRNTLKLRRLASHTLEVDKYERKKPEGRTFPCCHCQADVVLFPIHHSIVLDLSTLVWKRKQLSTSLNIPVLYFIKLSNTFFQMSTAVD